MNAYTTTPNARPTAANNTLGRLFQTFVTELRRAIELAGEPYQHGALPPL